MRHPGFLLTAAMLLVLAACGGNNSDTFPDPTISSVSPGTVMAGDEIIITGTNYYAIDDRAGTRVEVCGITAKAELVDPVTRSILLPPARNITALVGTELKATIPMDGFTPGVSSARVTRPDGVSVTLEEAVTCVAPTPVEPEPEEPVLPAPPVIESFTGPTTVELGQTATFTWAITNEDDSVLTCTIDPGDPTDAVTLEDCAAAFEYTYSAAGGFTARLTVQDENGQSDTATHDVTVTEPEPVTSAGPRISEFTPPGTAFVGETITFTWAVDYDGPHDLSCIINTGDSSGPQVVACDRGEFEYAYSAAGFYPVEFKIADERGREATAGRLLAVTHAPVPAAPVITEFAASEPAIVEETVTFTWAIGYTGLDDLTCTINPGDATGEQPVDCASGSY